MGGITSAVQWVGDFGLGKRTPDYGIFRRLGSKIGEQKLSKIFAKISCKKGNEFGYSYKKVGIRL
ncbi:hypothetical protein MIDIC_460001 [Alphaproteobacteria bacterium]